MEKQNTLVANVQAQDADIAQDALKELGIVSYQMPSVGGFLGRKNVTLVIMADEEKYDKIIELLKNTCGQRIEYVGMPLDSAPLSVPNPAPVFVGGATIYGITSDRTEFI